MRTNDALSYLYMGPRKLQVCTKPFSIRRFRAKISIRCLIPDTGVRPLEMSFNSESLFALDLSSIKQDQPSFVTFVNEKCDLRYALEFTTSMEGETLLLRLNSLTCVYQPQVETSSNYGNPVQRLSKSLNLRVSTALPSLTYSNSRHSTPSYSKFYNGSSTSLPSSGTSLDSMYTNNEILFPPMNTNPSLYSISYNAASPLASTRRTSPYSSLTTPSFSPRVSTSSHSFSGTSHFDYDSMHTSTTSKRLSKNKKSSDSTISSILQHNNFTYELIKGFVPILAQV